MTHSDDWEKKVVEIFKEGFGDQRIGPMPLAAIEAALTDLKPQFAQDIAFHLTDWLKEAAFLVALAMYPQHFTPEEVNSGVTACLIHIPNHVAAAATLGGWPMKDIFNVGATIEPANADEDSTP